jgi:2-polyprenyl-3-methyl-5-hydroxy-6-metoxy-1,4-benzoquinol methylase
VTQHLPEIDRYIRRELPNLDGKRVLDVGCGRGGIGYLLRTHPGGTTAYIVGVDIHEPYIEFSARFALYDELILGDAVELALEEFDVVLACEVLEHIEAVRSHLLLAKLEGITRERLIVSTPNGNYLRGPVDGVISEAHLSIWTAAWFTTRGYSVRGIGNRWCRFGESGRLGLALWYATTPLSIRIPQLADTIVASKSGTS